MVPAPTRRGGRVPAGAGRAFSKDSYGCRSDARGTSPRLLFPLAATNFVAAAAEIAGARPDRLRGGRVPKWPKGADCKSAGISLRWFESNRAHLPRKRGFCVHAGRYPDPAEDAVMRRFPVLFCPQIVVVCLRRGSASRRGPGRLARDAAAVLTPATLALASPAVAGCTPRRPSSPASESSTGPPDESSRAPQGP